jgi:hypothetical protein
MNEMETKSNGGVNTGRSLVGVALVIGAVGGGVVTSAATASAADIGPCTGRAQPDTSDWASPGKLFVGTLYFNSQKFHVRARFSAGAQQVSWRGEYGKGLKGSADTSDIVWSNWDRLSFKAPVWTEWGDRMATVVMMPQACNQEAGQVLHIYSEIHHIVGGSIPQIVTYKTNTHEPLKLIDG